MDPFLALMGIHTQVQTKTYPSGRHPDPSGRTREHNRLVNAKMKTLTSPQEQEKYVWEPEDTVTKTLKSLDAFKGKFGPKDLDEDSEGTKVKVGKKHIKESYKIFDHWIDDMIGPESKYQLETKEREDKFLE